MFTKRTIRFQSTLPREERPTTHAASMSSNVYFNPRSHERSDCKCSTINAISTYFNPRSHERSDAENETEIAVLKISIHAPTRGATVTSLISFNSVVDFNPRSHERSDPHIQRAFPPTCHISIHAPTRGATPFPEIQGGYMIHFNPRSHERSDKNCIEIH